MSIDYNVYITAQQLLELIRTGKININYQGYNVELIIEN